MTAALWGPEGRVIQDDCSIVGARGKGNTG